jgi:hypothetical protein
MISCSSSSYPVALIASLELWLHSELRNRDIVFSAFSEGLHVSNLNMWPQNCDMVDISS